ncbi:hypothetical protein LINPERHAP1_LOCUS8207 [Linum perenne]
MLTATTEPLQLVELNGASVRCCPSSNSEEPGCGWLPFGFCVESAACAAISQTDSDDFLSPSLQIGAEIGRVVSSFCRSHHLAPEGEGSLPCDGFNHVFDLVKKGNKAFRDNSFEEELERRDAEREAEIAQEKDRLGAELRKEKERLALEMQKEKQRVENVIQKERQLVARLEAIVTKLSTTTDEPFPYIDQDSMASDDEEAQTSEKDDD